MLHGLPPPSAASSRWPRACAAAALLGSLLRFYLDRACGPLKLVDTTNLPVSARIFSDVLAPASTSNRTILGEHDRQDTMLHINGCSALRVARIHVGPPIRDHPPRTASRGTLRVPRCRIRQRGSELGLYRPLRRPPAWP